MKPTREQVREVAEALVNIYDMPFQAPTLGIDLDGCVDECPVFFRTLTAVWPGDVVVITFRHDREKTVQDLKKVWHSSYETGVGEFFGGQGRGHS